MRRTPVPWFVVALTLALGAPAAAEARTLRIEVNERGGDRTTVELPASVVKAFAFVADLDVEIDDVHLGDDAEACEALRRGWAALREADPGAAVTVTTGDAEVRLVRATDGLTMHVRDRDGEEVRVDLPEYVAYLVLDRRAEHLDGHDLVEALFDAPSGTMLRVETEDAEVRLSIH